VPVIHVAHPAAVNMSLEHWEADHRRRMAEEFVARGKAPKPDSPADILPIMIDHKRLAAEGPLSTLSLGDLSTDVDLLSVRLIN
jgi:hypothetical protein